MTSNDTTTPPATSTQAAPLTPEDWASFMSEHPSAEIRVYRAPSGRPQGGRIGEIVDPGEVGDLERAVAGLARYQPDERYCLQLWAPAVRKGVLAQTFVTVDLPPRLPRLVPPAPPSSTPPPPQATQPLDAVDSLLDAVARVNKMFGNRGASVDEELVREHARLLAEKQVQEQLSTASHVGPLVEAGVGLLTALTAGLTAGFSARASAPKATPSAQPSSTTPAESEPARIVAVLESMLGESPDLVARVMRSTFGDDVGERLVAAWDTDITIEALRRPTLAAAIRDPDTLEWLRLVSQNLGFTLE